MVNWYLLLLGNVSQGTFRGFVNIPLQVDPWFSELKLGMNWANLHVSQKLHGGSGIKTPAPFLFEVKHDHNFSRWLGWVQLKIPERNDIKRHRENGHNCEGDRSSTRALVLAQLEADVREVLSFWSLKWKDLFPCFPLGLGPPFRNSLAFSLVAHMAKNPSAMLETQVQSLGWEDPLEKGMPTHHWVLGGCLENPMDRGTWWATVHEVAKSWTWLSSWHCSLCFHRNSLDFSTFGGMSTFITHCMQRERGIEASRGRVWNLKEVGGSSWLLRSRSSQYRVTREVCPRRWGTSQKQDLALGSGSW